MQTNKDLISVISKYFPTIGLILTTLRILYYTLLIFVIFFAGIYISYVLTLDIHNKKLRIISFLVLAIILQGLEFYFAPEVLPLIKVFFYDIPSQIFEEIISN